MALSSKTTNVVVLNFRPRNKCERRDQLFRGLIEKFAEDLHELVAELQDALDSMDLSLETISESQVRDSLMKQRDALLASLSDVRRRISELD